MTKKKSEKELTDFVIRPTRIPSQGPSITQSEIDLITDAATSGWYHNMSKHMNMFIEEFKSYTGMKYVLPVNCCTSAIHLAMLALDIGPGDEVIVPDVTWVASACPVTYVGAKVIFADIDPQTWCISPESFEARITKRTKAVMAVGLAGNMPEMDKINRIARKHGIAVIEDAAESIGSTYMGKPAGTLGKIGVYSFNGTKLMVSGQGGAFVTNDKRLYERARLFSHHGIDKTPGARYYWSTLIGYNYNWTNLQAACALAQLRRINELIKTRREIFSWYQKRLSAYPEITLNFEPENTTSTYWLTTAVVDPALGLTKEEICEHFQKYNVDCRPFFYPVSSMPPYKKYIGKKNMAKLNPVSYGMSQYAVCLPNAFTLKEDDVDYICDVFIRQILKLA